MFVLLAGCQPEKKQLPPLSETYNRNDKKPFGGYVAYNHLKKLFNDKFIELNTDPFDTKWREIKSFSSGPKYSLYMIVTKNLYLDFSEAEAMVNYVKEGNDLFISADYIGDDLLDRIGCETERYNEVVNEVNGKMHDTYVRMFFGKGFDTKKFSYYYYPFFNSFSNYDSSSCRVLGVNETGQPNYVLFFIGNGRLYLHAAPRTFGNYFLLTANNYEYFENVISYLRFNPKNIYWDEFYASHSARRRPGDDNGSGDGNDGSFSSFSVINKNPPLLWAFWLSLIALLLYVLFNIKRRQRVIKEIPPNINTTVAFTETVGRLYLQKKDNKNISEKIITYFYEHIRNKYFLNTAHVNDEFINNLAGKSGVPVEKAKKLFNTIADVRSAEKVSDIDLLSLNEQVENFYKNKT